MKKITFIGILTVLSTIVFALPVIAATTASLSPSSINVVAGKSFNVTIGVNPQGVSNYVEKLEINFPSNILEVISFSLGSNWMSLTQSGYDSIDNTNGVFIKTAGYPGGFSGATTFGTITFHVKKSGSGTIKIGNNSLAFEANNQNVITGNETVFTAPVNTIKAESTVQEATNTVPIQEVIQSTSTTQLNIQTAAVTKAGFQGNTWLWIFLSIIVLGIVGGWIYSRK